MDGDVGIAESERDRLDEATSKQLKTSLYSYQIGLLTDKSRFRKINKARQIGFSFTIALEGYLNAMRSRQEILYVSASGRQAKRLISQIKSFARLDKIKFDPDRQEEIGFPNGSLVLSLPCSSTTARGYPADRLYFDEFAHWKNDKEMFQAVVPSLTRTDKVRSLTVVSTPMGKQGEFYRIWEEDENYSRHQVDIYEAIKGGCPVDVDLCRKLLPDDIAFRQEYLGEFVDESTSFFPYELTKRAINYELENWSIDQLKACKNPLYAGYDPAKIADSGVFYIVERGNKVHTRHIKEWRGVDYSEQLAYIERMCVQAGVTKLITDQTGVGQKIQEDLKRSMGSRAEGMTFTTGSKEKMITDLKVLFQDTLIEIPYNMDLINQLHSLKRKITESGTVRYQHEEGKHDDYVWALAMACYGFTMCPPIKMPTSTPIMAGRNYTQEIRQYERSAY